MSICFNENQFSHQHPPPTPTCWAPVVQRAWSVRPLPLCTWYTNSMVASGADLTPKKGNVSSVSWNWFGVVASETEQTAPRCKVCLKAIATKGNTNSWLQHIKQRHAPVWERCCSLRNEQDRGSPSTATKKQPTVLETLTNCMPYDKKGARWKAVTDAVAMLYIYILQEIWCSYTSWKSQGLFTWWKFCTPGTCYQAANIFLKLPCLNCITVHAKG